MQLTIFNGSPRGKKSNTTLLMDHFARGFCKDKNNTVGIFYLNRTNDTDDHVEHFKRAEKVILAFPLYTDAMPGIVKHFIEALHPLCNNTHNAELGFVIQSGFPEPIHSRFVARYMEKTARRLGSSHFGTVIRGGVEGIAVKPPWMTKKLFLLFYQLGKDFAEKGILNPEIIQKLTPRDKLSFMEKMLYRLLILTGMGNMYWNMNLKKNQSFEKRFARPHKET